MNVVFRRYSDASLFLHFVTVIEQYDPGTNQAIRKIVRHGKSRRFDLQLGGNNGIERNLLNTKELQTKKCGKNPDGQKKNASHDFTKLIL